MRAVQLQPDDAALELDVCVPCMTIWFDQGEFGRLGGRFEPRRAVDPARVEAIGKIYMSGPFEEVDRELDRVLDGIFTLVEVALLKLGWWKK